MITIIAGSRDFNDYEHFKYLLSKVEEVGWTITTVVSGGAKGADRLAQLWAKDGRDIDLIVIKPDWGLLGKSAGYVRNIEMAETAHALVAFWDGSSKGTKHMIDTAIKRGLYTKVFYV